MLSATRIFVGDVRISSCSELAGKGMISVIKEAAFVIIKVIVLV